MPYCIPYMLVVLYIAFAALGVAEDPPEVGLVQGHAGEGCMPREWDVGRTGGLMGLKLTLRRRKTH